jgi:hypothetical protein
MEKLNYYDSDINMIWQSSPEESGEALKKLSKALASYNYEYEKANDEINSQLAKLGISSEEKLFDVLNKLADIWIKASTTGYKEEGYWPKPGTDEETDKSNEKSDLEIFGEKLKSEIFSESNQPHTKTISFGPPMIIKADNTDNDFIIF